MKDIIKKLRLIYYRYTNKTQMKALYFLNRSESDGKYKCPVCGFITTNSYIFNDHISYIHGYPKDIDLSYMIEVDYKKVHHNVEKANPEYLKYL